MKKFDPDDIEGGICGECGNECDGVVVDNGIGPYEFWGHTETHHDYQTVSRCCEAEIVEGGVKELRSVVRTARSDHKDGKVKAGDVYRETVRRHWRRDGPNWITTTKKLLRRKENGSYAQESSDIKAPSGEGEEKAG